MGVYKYPNIEAERARLGYSQEELIKALGYKERKSYQVWLSNGNIPTSVLMKMADLFDCSIDYLLGRTRNPM
jgi:transcriptional regulator with XRE-family HTH domain